MNAHILCLYQQRAEHRSMTTSKQHDGCFCLWAVGLVFCGLVTNSSYAFTCILAHLTLGFMFSVSVFPGTYLLEPVGVIRIGIRSFSKE